MDLLEGLATTRAIRRYTADPIPDDDLNTILWHATRAPSGTNRQPFRFLVLRDGDRARAAKDLLGEAFRAGWAQKLRDERDTVAPDDDPTSARSRMAASMQHFVDHFHEAPVVVLPCYGRHRGADVSEGASVYPACQNLLLAARALGYGGVITMWHGFVEPQLRELLSIPDDIAIAAVIPLGRPMGKHGPVRRRPIRDLVFDDEWAAPAPWARDPEGTRFTGGRTRS